MSDVVKKVKGNPARGMKGVAPGDDLVLPSPDDAGPDLQAMQRRLQIEGLNAIGKEDVRKRSLRRSEQRILAAGHRGAHVALGDQLLIGYQRPEPGPEALRPGGPDNAVQSSTIDIGT